MSGAQTDNANAEELTSPLTHVASEKAVDDFEDSIESHPSSSATLEDHNQDGALERNPTTKDDQERPPLVTRMTTGGSAVHSVFSKNQRRFIVVMASWAGFFSPVSANIYYPALNSLKSDLHVGNTLINLTLTSYMIFQGLAPAFIGDLADIAGRRPAYMTCFILYIAANIGLALQNSYAALFLLRCLQSSGSSGTIALSSGVVADVATASERGSYMGFVTAGALLGPAVGPVIGGVLAQFLGWRSIFWFLTIFGASFLVIFAIFFPETARSAVGNGSIPPKGLNMSLMNYLAVRKIRKQELQEGNLPPEESIQTSSAAPKKRKVRFPNPLASVHIILDPENALLLFWSGFLFCVFYDVVVTVPSSFSKIYHFNDLQIGLCYIPFGIGSMCAALSNGHLLDRNFARHARKANLPIRKGRQTDLSNFPIERARLEVSLPFLYLFAVLTIVYGWTLTLRLSLAAPLTILFFLAFAMTSAFNAVSTLLVDFYPQRPATATAANNLVRCLLGAGATAVIAPMVDAMGEGWCFTFLGLWMVLCSPMVWWVWWRGMGMRRRREEKAQMKGERRERKLREVEGGEAGASDEKTMDINGRVTDGEGHRKQQQHRMEETRDGLRPELDGKVPAGHGGSDEGGDRQPAHQFHRTYSQQSGTH